MISKLNGISTEENKAIVRQFVMETFFEQEMDAVEEYIAEDFVRHAPRGDEIHGREGCKRFVNDIDTAFPDAEGTIDAMIAEGDGVMYRWSMHATHEGEFMGIDPTGRSISTSGMDQVRFEDDEIAEI